MNKIVKEKLKQGGTLLIIVIAFVCALAIMLKYENEGEKNMPFVLKEIFTVSSAEAENKAENPNNNKWNMNINQYNDVYIQFEKNEKYTKTAYIKNITIENINITNPELGTVSLYTPNSTEGKLFSYEDPYLIKNSLTYKGASIDNKKTLEVANQGGTIIFRIVNKNVSEYISNSDDEIAYDGTLLNKTNVNLEKIKFNINFDIVIQTENNQYRGNITMSLPEKDIEQGVSKTTINDFSNIIFKRENT